MTRLLLKETRDRIRAEIGRDGLNNWGRIPDWCHFLDLMDTIVLTNYSSSKRASAERSPGKFYC